MFTDNRNFYPTPPQLAEKMAALIIGTPNHILEPSAGKGDLIEAVWALPKYSSRGYGYSRPPLSCIEKNPLLQATLRGKEFKVIDSDFLSYSGQDKFDLIIANPPFDEGDKHLLKAIDIMYRGQIIFLLNAETIKNPHTNNRKLLVQKLKELKAKTQFIKGAFLDAERKTKVEVALVNIVIDRKIETELFAGCNDQATPKRERVKTRTNKEVATGHSVDDLVAEYDEMVRIGTETITNYYRHYNKVGGFIRLEVGERKESLFHIHSDADLTNHVSCDLNNYLRNLRKSFWQKVLSIDAVHKRLTEKKRAEFNQQMNEQCFMDFTSANIYQFVQNIIGGYEGNIIDAVLDTFDMFTRRHAWHGENPNEENIHYFNGWKTNDAFRVKKKVIIPGKNWSCSFYEDGWSKPWRLRYDTANMLDDIDKVMNHFDGMTGYISMRQALEDAFARGSKFDRMAGIKSTYFTMTPYKKGTIHLIFNSEDILRRFNVVACKGKGWLPQDYGVKPVKQLTADEKAVATSFEGIESYSKNVGKQLLKLSFNSMQIGYKEAA